ncbi:MAG: redoxin domain-containing protein [Phycisphaerales bacterium]
MRSIGHIPRFCLLLLVSALLGAGGCANDNSGQSTAPAVVETAGPLTAYSSGLVDLDGKRVDLRAKQPSPITVVVFTRTDCPISNRFAPDIRRLYETYHSQGVEFFLVYVDPHEQPEAIHRHLQEYRYPCQGLRDPKHTLVAQCGATITPEAVVFDRNSEMVYLGRINDLYVRLGQARNSPTTRDLDDAIEATVQGKRVATPRTAAVGCVIADLDR